MHSVSTSKSPYYIRDIEYWSMSMTNANHYTYRVLWSEEDQEHVALCAEFPSLSWLAGKPEDALRGMRKIIEEVLLDMEQRGEKIPESYSSKKYSGKVMLRMAPEVHRQLSVEAAEAQISLNRLINARLAHV